MIHELLANYYSAIHRPDDIHSADIMVARTLASNRGASPVEIQQVIMRLESGFEPEAWREVLGA